MRQLVRVNMLTSAVGIALFGISFSMTTQAARPGVDAVASTVAVQASSVGRYIVTFVEPGLLHNTGNVAGIGPTAPSAVGSRKLDTKSAAARSYTAYLDAQRAEHVAAIEHALGRSLKIQHTYGINTNGISAEMSEQEATAVAALDGVSNVRAVRKLDLATFRGPKFIGADKIWDGTAVPSGIGTRGAGVKVGIIDTGTHTGHPELVNDPTCGFDDTNPKLHAVDCNTSSAGVCNGPTPDAQVSGHGVHTQTTVAGNTIDNTADPSPQLPDGVTMSGVAPCATVYSYRVEAADGSLTGDAIEAAIESLAVDQIDVANYSIGVSCSNGTPWEDEDRMFLDSVNADVFIAASAGNTRSSCTNPVGGVAHMGPWMLTVAASTQDELFAPELTVTGPGTVPANLQNIAIVPGSNVHPTATSPLSGYPLRDYPTNLAGCTDTGGFPAHYFDGSIAVVRRGFNAPGTVACSFVEKVTNAANAGATMVVIANNANQTVSPLTDGTTIPSYIVEDLATSDALIAFVSANLGPAPDGDTIFKDGFDGAVTSPYAAGNYLPGAISDVQGDVLAGFSERGPTPPGYDDLTKPDITAPGVNIYAGGRVDDGNYMLDSGTSMSSPHMAGSAALVRAVHPDWTVEEVKSALMTTATNAAGVQEDGTTPWTVDQVGSGRVDLTKAALAGLTLNETFANFVAANPNGGSLPMKDLNLPSMRNSSCETTCTWTRTVKNQLSTSGSWNASASATAFGLTVSPSSFTLAAGATQVLTITATPTSALSAEAFGEVNLVEASGQSPDQHLTAAIKGGGGSGAVGVTCTGGTCAFRIDVLASNFSAIGCQTAYCGLLWVNSYTPAPSDYPITINSVSEIFASGNGSNQAGDHINVYVYQDDDNDPTNGATLVGSSVGYTIGTPVNSFATITLTSPITVNGPGNILIAMTNPNGNVGFNPASADTGPFAGRSWLANYDDTVAGVAPDLSDVGLELNTDAIAGFVGNWLIRATGTNGAGQPLVLDPAGGGLNTKR